MVLNLAKGGVGPPGGGKRDPLRVWVRQGLPKSPVFLGLAHAGKALKATKG